MASFLLSVLSFVALASAAGIPRTENGVGIMKLPISTIPRNNTLSKRQIDTGLANPEYGTIYIVSIEIGTPPQPVSIQIDTGSSDLWVDPTCSTSGSVTFCQSYPVYDPYSSSTALDTGYPMYLAYGKGECSGEYLLDTVILGGVSIQQQQFGWASSSDSLPTGIMGISWGVELIGYYNIIDQLAIQGITNSRAFSLDLGNVDTAEGSIIFGGIDTMKYTGPLEKRPIIPADQAPDGDRYWIYMSSVGITIPGAASKIYTSQTYEQAVFLDSGGTLSRLPANLVAAMIADFPGAVDNGNGLYTVPCSYRSQAGTLDFGFGNTVIHVPYHEFIWMTGSVCVFGAVANAASDVDWVLGDTFLRSAYVVYDQDNRNLLLANSANCGTNLVPIGSGVNAVPSVTGACTAAVTSTSITPSSTSTSTSKATTSSTSTTSISSSLTSVKLSTTSTPSSSASSKTSTTITSSTTSKTPTTTSTSTSSSTSAKSSSTSSTSSSSSTKASTTSTTSTGKTSSSTTSTSTSKTSTTSSKTTSTTSSKSTTSTSTKTSSTSTSTTSKSLSTSTTTTSKSSITSKSLSTSTTTTGKSSTTLSTVSTKTSTSTSGTATSTPVINGYAYVGCFLDSSPHSLTKILSNSSMSIELCLSIAHGSTPPYAYAGVEYGQECWAATTSPAAATPTSGAKACTIACVGNAKESCGGRGMFNLWASPTPTP